MAVGFYSLNKFAFNTYFILISLNPGCHLQSVVAEFKIQMHAECMYLVTSFIKIVSQKKCSKHFDVNIILKQNHYLLIEMYLKHKSQH